jgi:DNA-binding NtrC family response regulator
MAATAFLHILVVDDDCDVREVVTAMLEQMGYRVSAASNGIAARQVLAQGGVDLLIADQLMFGERGKDLADHAQSSGVPSILITGDEASARELEVGQYIFLSKPFRMGEFYDKVSQACCKTAEISHDEC